MKNIAEIDKNLNIASKINRNDFDFFGIEEPCVSLHGLIFENGFRRMEEKAAKTVSEAVYELSSDTAGGRIRFRTNSERIAIICKTPSFTRFPHMPASGVSGFDIYSDTDGFEGAVIPPWDTENGYEGEVNMRSRGMRDITIGFPLYNNISEIYIGILKGATLEKANNYKHKKTVIFYGSSITQGGCVSRPGNSYAAILSRWLNFDYINLGFSGSAKAEPAMAEYISNIDMSVFVMDYDHNAPNAEHLENTHEDFFKFIRAKNPELPIIIISRPDFKFCAEESDKRREVIKKTYENAISAGDKNIRFIDGETLFGDTDWDLCSVDKVHPNDLGHFRMAEVIKKTLKEVL